MRRILLFSFALLTSVLVHDARAQYTGTLRLELLDAQGRPLAAVLRLPAARRSAPTDSMTGRVIMAGLAPGTYRVEVVIADRVLDSMHIEIAPLRVTDLGAVRAGTGAERCSYRGMYREPWSMSRIGPDGDRTAAGVFTVDMGCGE